MWGRDARSVKCDQLSVFYLSLQLPDHPRVDYMTALVSVSYYLRAVVCLSTYLLRTFVLLPSGATPNSLYTGWKR